MPGIYDPKVYDEKLSITTDEGWNVTEQLLKEEGLSVGHSSGANLAGALRLARRARRKEREGRHRHALRRSRRPLLRAPPLGAHVHMALIPYDVQTRAPHLAAAYPEEGCGVIFKGPNGLRAVPLKNVYDKYHARFPDQFPRTNKTAYRMEELELARQTETAEAAGEALVCVFHSHCDVGSYFSKEDSDMAAPDGIEMRPGIKWLVVAVDARKITVAKLFTFANGRFAEDESLRL